MQLNKYLQYLIRAETETDSVSTGLALIAKRKRERLVMYLELVKKRLLMERETRG